MRETAFGERNCLGWYDYFQTQKPWIKMWRHVGIMKQVEVSWKPGRKGDASRTWQLCYADCSQTYPLFLSLPVAL